GARTAPGAAQFSGKLFRLDPNADGLAAIRFNFAADATAVTLHTPRGPRRIKVGYDGWGLNTTDLRPPHSAPVLTDDEQSGAVAASGAWQDEATFAVKLWWLGTPFAQTQRYRFTANEIRIEQRMNVGFGPLEATTLTGRQS